MSPSSPQKNAEEIEAGILVLKYVIRPPGCAGLVGVSICDAIHQIWPTNASGWFKGEGVFEFHDRFRFVDPPYQLDIYTYNEDDTYDHEPIIILAIERTDQVYTMTTRLTLNDQYQYGEED